MLYPYQQCHQRTILFQLVLILVAYYYCQEVQAQPQPIMELECPSPNDPRTYDWETWNYYQLLGLLEEPQQQRKKDDLESKDIRKAYRKQAQLWHPDKQQQSDKKKLEESTARFSRIAEAYKALTDPATREEYDLFLKYCEELEKQQQQQQNQNHGSASKSSSYRQQWNSLFQNLADPLRVFEDFLFGTTDEDANFYNNEKDFYTNEEQQAEDNDDPWKVYSSSFRERSPPPPRQQQQQQQEPARVHRQQEKLRDPLTGEEFIRLSQTEEYPTDPQTGQFYYRVMSQEFIEIFDPYTGKSVRPVSKKYLRDEGYRSEQQQKQQQQQQQQQRPHQSSSQSAPPHTPPAHHHPPSILFPDDILTPNSKLLISPNRRYYAGLSADCELLVMADNQFGDDDLIWTSGTFGNKNNCFATLKGPHLVVAMGRPEVPHHILWYSEAMMMDDDEDDMDHGGFFATRPNSSSRSSSTYHLAQLDNDGSLAVYQVWSLPRHGVVDDDNDELFPMATRAFLSARHFVLGHVRVEYDFLYSPFSVTYKRCIYATGRLGCFRVARRLYQLSLDIHYRLKNMIRRIDSLIDTWMDLILEDDYFFVHALKSSIMGGKNGAAAFGGKVAHKSARLVRQVLQYFLSSTTSR